MKHPIPEAPETIEAQLEWLRRGKRRAVLLPIGTAVPRLGQGENIMVIAEGLLVWDNRRYARAEIYAQAIDDLGGLLGYGVPKPVEGEPESIVVVRGPNGEERQAVATSSKRLDEAQTAAEAIAGPGDSVHVENGQRVIADRLRSLDARELTVRPFNLEQDTAALLEAAAADRHKPLHVTHVIERGGAIIGYLGINSLPLYRLWFDSRQVKASDSLRLLFLIENQYRMSGAKLIGTIINTESPFYPVAARGGYLECGGDRLFLKGL